MFSDSICTARSAGGRRWRWASGLTATLFGAALYLGAGAAQAQVVTSFAAACSGKAAGAQATIGPFYTGDVTQGASTWTISPLDGATQTFGTPAGVTDWLDVSSLAQPPGADWTRLTTATDLIAYTYTLEQTITVDPTIINPTSINVTGIYTADDYLSAIQVAGNTGTNALTLSGTGYQGGGSHTLATDAPGLGSLFQTGDNTLSFVVQNTIAPNTGLYANFTISAACVGPTVTVANQTVPTLSPWALALLALLLAGGAAAVRRRALV